MTDPLAEQLGELAPTVDTHAAHDEFVAIRRRRRRRRRLVTGGLAVLALIAAGAGVTLLGRDHEAGSIVTAREPSATTSSASSVTSVAATPPSPSTALPASTPPAALLAVDGCPTISATDLRTNDRTSLFGRATPDGLSIQAIATPAGVEGPYVAVLRYRSETRTPTIGDRVDVRGRPARLFVGPDGQGQISWILDDGSEAYLRARGLQADQLLAIANALVPRPPDAAIVGFDVAGTAPTGYALVAETTTPLKIRTASTSCATADLRVGVVDALPAAQYAIGVDDLPLPALQRRGDHVVWAVSHDPVTAAAALGLQPEPSSTNAVASTTIAPIPTVSFTTERSAVGQPGCTASACRFVDVTAHGFEPGTTITITCHSDTTGPFGATDATVGSDGSATQEACYFGYPGARFWVTADDHTSPTIDWPTN